MFLGIDVSKATLDVALLLEAPASKPQAFNTPRSFKMRHRVFKNTAQGHEQLLVWLQDQGTLAGNSGPVHACLEATGTYAESVARSLYEAGHLVSLVNPFMVRAFGQSQLKRTKTDRADAQLIARFCALSTPPLWKPTAPEISELQALVRRIETLEEMKRMEENRLSSGVSCQIVRASLQDHILYLDTQIKDTKRQIRDHIEAHPALKEQAALLQSIPGVGEATAALVLAEIGDISQFHSARQVAAFAGLVPRVRESGSSVRGKPRLSKVGSPRLRKGLYFPAMTALRFNPLLRALKERLEKQGKCPMLILGAAMRKLLCLAYGVLKSGLPFDENFNAQTSTS